MLDNKIYNEELVSINIKKTKKMLDYETESEEIHITGKTLQDCYTYLKKIKGKCQKD
jgi:hypothetical protein